MLTAPTHLASDRESRVLFLPPTRRDAQITVDLLKETGIECHVCSSIGEVISEIEDGVGAILVTEATACDPEFLTLVERLKSQPEWSDIPVVLIARTTAVRELQPVLQSLTNVTLVERPAPVTSITSAVSSAVRSRERQYQVRDKVREIAQAGEQFQVMANSIPQLAWMSHHDGAVFWFNRRWYEYTGTNHRSMVGWGWTSLIEPGALDQTMEKFWTSLNAGVRFEMEFSIRGADGTHRTFLAQVEPIRDEANQIARWLGTYTDIDEQMRLRKAREAMIEGERHARIEAEKAARLKDEFLATLSHELRSPLSSILGWAYLLQKSPNDPNTVADAGAVIGRSGETLKALVDDLLDLSRISSGKFRLEFDSVDLPALVSTAVEGMRPTAEAKSIDLQTDIEVLPKKIWGDSRRLHQIVTNLLSNAIRFTPDGGTVKVGLASLDGHARISVADTGEGIDPEFLPFIFDRFRQADASTARKHGGMGIGLSLVKQFAELHGGKVSVFSDGVDRGSTFAVTLPYRPAVTHPAPASGDAPGSSIDLNGVSVLIVDDDSGVRDLLSRVLSERGAETRLAASADEALTELGNEVPSVVISDVGMPVKDGYELMREVRSKGYEVPAIALTAFVRKEDRDSALESGFQHHLAKPVELVKLLELVDQVAKR